MRGSWRILTVPECGEGTGALPKQIVLVSFNCVDGIYRVFIQRVWIFVVFVNISTHQPLDVYIGSRSNSVPLVSHDLDDSSENRVEVCGLYSEPSFSCGYFYQFFSA
jgi:hypothetical protein